jgi:hypothetical protein
VLTRFSGARSTYVRSKRRHTNPRYVYAGIPARSRSRATPVSLCVPTDDMKRALYMPVVLVAEKLRLDAVDLKWCQK